MVELLEDKGLKYGEKNVWVEVLGKVLLILTDKHATELLIYSNSGIVRKYIIVAAYASMCKNVTEHAVTVVLLRNPQVCAISSLGIFWTLQCLNVHFQSLFGFDHNWSKQSTDMLYDIPG